MRTPEKPIFHLKSMCILSMDESQSYKSWNNLQRVCNLFLSFVCHCKINTAVIVNQSHQFTLPAYCCQTFSIHNDIYSIRGEYATIYSICDDICHDLQHLWWYMPRFTVECYYYSELIATILNICSSATDSHTWLSCCATRNSATEQNDNKSWNNIGCTTATLSSSITCAV